MKLFFLKAFIFIVLMFGILKFLDLVYTRYAFNHIDVCKKPEWIMAKNHTKYSFAFLGNSRVDNMIDIACLEKKTGKTGINIGYTGSNFSEMYLLLYQFLKNKNTTDNLILEIDHMTLNSKKVEFVLHYPTYLHLFNDSLVSEVYKDNMEPFRFYMWKYLPFVRYMEYSNRFVLYKMIKGGFECKQNSALDITKGTEFLTVQKIGTVFPKKYYSIDPWDEGYLDKIIALSKKEKINIIFYTAPIFNEHLKQIINYRSISAHIRKIAKINNVPYLDFAVQNSSLTINKNDYFDETHLKREGTQKFSAVLADSVTHYLK
jgi:hypothetical protein